MKSTLTCYTDGGCWPNPGPGSFGYVIVENDVPLHEYAESNPNTTNSRMELSAMIHLLHFLGTNVSKEEQVVIYTDSEYVRLGINVWRHNWIKKKWEGVKNLDLWLQLSYLVDKLPNVEVKWIRGHAGDKWNEYVDKMCLKARKQNG